MLAYAGVLHLLRWCRQNSHANCSKIKWRSTAYTVLRYFSGFPDRFIEKIWSIVKRIESTCTLSFFFLRIGNRIVLFFHNSNSNCLIYSRVLGGAQFCLFLVAVLAYSTYSEIAKSSPPQHIFSALIKLSKPSIFKPLLSYPIVSISLLFFSGLPSHINVYISFSILFTV